MNLYKLHHLIWFCVVFGIICNILVVLKISRDARNFKCFQKIQKVVEKLLLLQFVEPIYVSEVIEKESPEIPEIYNKSLQTMLFSFVTDGIGNKLFEVISLLGIAKTLKRRPVINATNPDYMQVLYADIQPLFPKLVEQFSLELIPDHFITRERISWGKCCMFDDPKKLQSLKDQYLILEGHYFQSYKFFHHLRSQIRDWLAPSKRMALKAAAVIPEKSKNDFIICTHIHRGEPPYNNHRKPSDPRFTRVATEYLVDIYEKSHSRISVVVLGDDLNFVNEVFTQSIKSNTSSYTVITVPILKPEIDLAISRIFCDVFLLTAPTSTFGWWLAYLAKKEAVIYYRDIEDSKDEVLRELEPVDYYPKEWRTLKTDKDGSIRL
ncbi:L-Fucosyltransferase [Caenorhabditis elegans]|uniref:L-Fucosyltransferase n=1 Tax=Caenorhabditis elegans TaxID=6239 RepID=O45837_CAEEL|nr:L-Fucosyltransferase [Caenorhabditis elegans]CAB03432.3 L-Fucosyltransferase [Caenorhabditis elegans]|eukprot:NP_506933.3 Uncharacterized protein CELE_T26E4.3 [Caenorhabditis elegans]